MQHTWDAGGNLAERDTFTTSAASGPIVVIGVSTGGDSTPPAAVSNLAAGSPTSSSVTLTWTAPGDHGSSGTAVLYDIRYSTSAITDANWAAATQTTGAPAPQVAGTNQSFVVNGLSPSTTYYFAMKTANEVWNWSGISNSPSGTTASAASGPIVVIGVSTGGDSTPPAAVSNLAAGSPTSSSITLTWTAPGDHGSSGTAVLYDIRYSTSAISDANWAAATQTTGAPAPQVAGTNQSFVVNGLSPSTTYYFAMKTANEVWNWSGISNSPSGATSAGGGGGNETESFTYDFLDRLTSVSGAYTESYTYNQIGNMLTKNGVTYTYPTNGVATPRRKLGGIEQLSLRQQRQYDHPWNPDPNLGRGEQTGLGIRRSIICLRRRW